MVDDWIMAEAFFFLRFPFIVCIAARDFKVKIVGYGSEDVERITFEPFPDN